MHRLPRRTAGVLQVGEFVALFACQADICGCQTVPDPVLDGEPDKNAALFGGICCGGCTRLVSRGLIRRTRIGHYD